MTRICIAGGPRTGKTTLAGKIAADIVTMECDSCGWPAAEHGCATPILGRVIAPVRHTDDLIHLGWSEASAAAALWFDEPGPWIVEGVAVPRALRKWLASHPAGKPCDVVYWLEDPHEELTPGQAAMTKGCATVWEEVADELHARGVEIVVGGAGAR